jgi:hypothetical protein
MHGFRVPPPPRKAHPFRPRVQPYHRLSCPGYWAKISPGLGEKLNLLARRTELFGRTLKTGADESHDGIAKLQHKTPDLRTSAVRKRVARIPVGRRPSGNAVPKQKMNGPEWTGRRLEGGYGRSTGQMLSLFETRGRALCRDWRQRRATAHPAGASSARNGRNWTCCQEGH